MKETKKAIKALKFKLFLLITLPMAIVSIGQAVLKEYIKIKVRQAAENAPAEIDVQKNGGQKI